MTKRLLKSKRDHARVMAALYGSAALLGAAAGTGVSVGTAEGSRQLVFTFDNVAIPVVDTAGVVARATLKFWDAPAGLVNVLTAVADLALTKSSAGVNDTWDGDFGVGTVAAAGDASLSTTEQDIIPTTATPQAVAGATTAKGVNTAPVILDGTATAVDAYLNILIDDADQDTTATPANIIVNGTITLTVILGGDK